MSMSEFGKSGIPVSFNGDQAIRINIPFFKI